MPVKKGGEALGWNVTRLPDSRHATRDDPEDSIGG